MGVRISSVAPASFPSLPLSDTSPEIASAQLERYREMSVERKLELVEDANATARVLALTGLATRHPEASERELHLRLFHLLHGAELATRAWGPLPEDSAG
jgi:hypothetical protein